MTTTKLLTVPIFNYDVEVVVTRNILKQRNKRAVQIGSVCRQAGLAQTSDSPTHFRSWIFLPPTATAGTIAHECHHAVCNMWTAIGAKNVDEEVHAYALGWLIDEVNSVMKKKAGH